MMCEDLLFALDIGTRTVVGLVLQETPDGLNIIASEVIEHENRAMLDGQIHNVIEVAKAVRQIRVRLEEKVNSELSKVAVAAAGRALKTIKQTHQIDFPSKREIVIEDVHTLELAAVQNAQKSLTTDNTVNSSEHHFVGYNVIAYRLDDMHIGHLVGQKGKKIEVDIISTFLPRIVVESLITVIQHADLKIQHLTLEPIAAANVVIPKEMHNFNLALVDIGAGTSDIAITRGGAIIAYAMVPVAGDEITEALAEHYLLDYAAGEKLKRLMATQDKILVRDILGSDLEVDSHEALLVLKPPVDNLSTLIANEILALNQKSPQAVILIGGGSLTPLLTQKLAEKLQLPPNRVGTKQAADIKGIIGAITNIESVQAITPIGIAVTCRQNNNQTSFIDAKLNDQKLNIFSLSTPTITDVLLASDLKVQRLHGRPGLALTFNVNGKMKTIKGTLGEPGRLEINGQIANLDSPINHGDEITYQPGKDGTPGSGLISDVVEFAESRFITINGTPYQLKTQVLMNSKLVTPDTPIVDRAEIFVQTPTTYREALVQLLEVPISDLISQEIRFTMNNHITIVNLGKYKILVNNHEIDLDNPVNEGDEIEIHYIGNSSHTIGDLYKRAGGTFDVIITFNGRELSIPTNHWEIIKNGHQVTIDTTVENGDQIICQPKSISFNRILSFINYQIPDSMSGRLEMTINGIKANFTDPVNSGDVLELKIL